MKNRVTVIALNLAFFGWLAAAVIGSALDAETLVERANNATQAALIAAGE